MGFTGRKPAPGETLRDFASAELESLPGKIEGPILWQGDAEGGWALAPFRPDYRPAFVLAVAVKVYASGGLYWSKLMDETSGPYNPRPVGRAFLAKLTDLDPKHAGDSRWWRKRNA